MFAVDKSDQILIQEVGKDEFLSFAYTGKIDMSTDTIQDLLVAANFFQCPSLVDGS